MAYIETILPEVLVNRLERPDAGGFVRPSQTIYKDRGRGLVEYALLLAFVAFASAALVIGHASALEPLP